MSVPTVSLAPSGPIRSGRGIENAPDASASFVVKIESMRARLRVARHAIRKDQSLRAAPSPSGYLAPTA
jgi:hypothetical protein